jgi:hypothetical protein
MAERTYKFKLTGLSPLLMHWDNLEGDDRLKEWRAIPENTANSVAGDDRTPPWTWKKCVYNDGEHIAVPEDNIRACLLKAGARVSKGKKNLTFKSDTQSGLMFLQPFLRFECDDKQIKIADVEAINAETFVGHCDAVRALGFKLFVKRAKIGASKHVRVRPLFVVWSVIGEIVVIEASITTAVLKTILEQAGRYVGLCDWRPSAPKSPGPFGRFEAELEAA